MKKLVLPVLLLVASLSSCSDDQTTKAPLGGSSDEYVGAYMSAGKNATRGIDVTTETLENSAGGVNLHINDSGTGDKLTSGAYVFTAEGSDWSQETPSLKWSDIDFPAQFYSMHDGEPKTLTITNGTASLDYSVENESSTHKDLVYHASELSVIPAGGKVNVLHKHALSKINIYAGTGTNKAYIARINLVNVDGDGTATITPVAAADAATDDGIEWVNGNNNNSAYEYYYIGAETTAAPTALQSTTTNPIINSDAKGSLIILPQSTTGATAAQIKTAAGAVSDSYIEVIYYLTGDNNDPIVGYSSVAERSDAADYTDEDQSKVLYVKAAFPVTYCFDPNNQYNITLGLGMPNSTGGLLVEDSYVDKDGNPVILTKKDTSETEKPEVPGIEPGDEILGDSDDYLDIIVSVDDWDGPTATELK